MSSEHPQPSPSQRARRPALAGAGSAVGWVGRAAGVLAGATTLVLAGTVLLGLILRGLAIDNAWTNDLGHFGLIWLAFVGAAYTGYCGAHVTSGISLEHLLGRHASLLIVLRLILVIGFLGVFIYSGYSQFHSSWMFSETTLDSAQWPIWLAKLALPVGGLAWIAAELHRLLAVLSGKPPSSGAGAD